MDTLARMLIGISDCVGIRWQSTIRRLKKDGLNNEQLERMKVASLLLNMEYRRGDQGFYVKIAA